MTMSFKAGENRPVKKGGWHDDLMVVLNDITFRCIITEKPENNAIAGTA